MIIKPGDILIFGTGERVTEERAKHYKTVWLEKLPGLKDVIIVGDVATLAVYREKEEQ